MTLYIKQQIMNQIRIEGKVYLCDEVIIKYIENLRNRLNIAHRSSEKILKHLETINKHGRDN